jgi:hypothetical protein
VSRAPRANPFAPRAGAQAFARSSGENRRERMSFNFGSIVSALQTAGVNAQSIVNVTQVLGGAAAENNALNIIMANSDNSKVIADEVTKIQEASPSAAVSKLLPEFLAPGITPSQVVDLVVKLEAVISQVGS